MSEMVVSVYILNDLIRNCKHSRSSFKLLINAPSRPNSHRPAVSGPSPCAERLCFAYQVIMPTIIADNQVSTFLVRNQAEL